MGILLHFFQSVGASPAHKFLDMVDNGLGTSAASSLRTCSCISLCPMDLCAFRSLWWTHTRSPPAVGSPSFPPVLPFPPGLVQCSWSICWWRLRKNLAGYLSLLHALGNLVSCFLPGKAHVFLNLPFITKIPMETFPVVLDVPGQA